MNRRSKRLLLMTLGVAIIVLAAIVAQVVIPGSGDSATAATLAPDGGGGAASAASLSTPSALSYTDRIDKVQEARSKNITSDERLAAAARREEAIAGIPGYQGVAVGVLQQPDFFGTANWAFSPALQKFVDTLPLLNVPNSLGNEIPIAVPDTITYPGSDYYELAVVQFEQKLHRDLPATTLRGYVQTNYGTDPSGHNTIAPAPVQYLGPQIITQKDRPVRIKFTNSLPLNEAGDLFIPVDHSVMGSGYGPLGADAPTPNKNYSDNRAVIHLHGGHTPWISDGTPHQWITPLGENTSYPKGVSTQNVPDMPDPGDGSQTYYYCNDQSSRLLFYHDHSWGITRLNVYVGEAAGYLIRDDTENDLIARNIIPSGQYEVPLIIQDKTFVDAPVIRDTDPTWNWGTGALDTGTGIRAPKTGDLWYPHVYMTAQNPYDPSGVNPFGRWHYGPWFFPPTTDTIQPVPNAYYDPNNPLVQPPEIPGVPWVSAPGESFLDTALVNGAIYPTLTVQPRAYRFRILNASNDRMWNLQMYLATGIISRINVTNPGSGYSGVVLVTISGGGGKGATAEAVVDEITGQITGINMVTVGSGYTGVPTVSIVGNGTGAAATAVLYTAPTEVGMVPATVTAGFPLTWPTDGRVAGVPDPAKAGPKWVQIGTESGFLSQPAIIDNQPITWNNNPTTFNFGNVDLHSLLVAPAERADVVVDFSQYAGKTLIVYNDAPAAFPAGDPRYDYYTASPDLSGEGGYTGTQAGYGPNTRTIMQINVAGTSNGVPYDLNALQQEFISDAGGPGVFQKSQNPIIVGQSEYNTTYNTTFPSSYPLWGLVRIQDWSMSFKTPDGLTLTLPFEPKAIHDEMGAAYDEYGRMSGKLGTELVGVNAMQQTFVLQNFVDPPNDIIVDSVIPGGATLGDGTQIWRITHNGVDTHPIHFHLMDVQIINRVAWDGSMRKPDANERGWKETIRVSPLEDTIVAVRATAADAPFGVPESVRPLNPSQPLGSPMGFSNLDPLTGNAVTTLNQIVNFGWEYVWHCHILSHEEMDMMRPISFTVDKALPDAPALSGSALSGTEVYLIWTDGTPKDQPSTLGNKKNEIGFRVERAPVTGGVPGTYTLLGKALANQTTFTDTTVTAGETYSYRIIAWNAAGESPSNAAEVLVVPVPLPPTNLHTTAVLYNQVDLAWTDNATNETDYYVDRADGSGASLTWVRVATLPAGTQTWSDTTVLATTTYSYRVIAHNALGDSAPSNVIAVTTPANVPAAPTNLHTTAVLYNRVALAWTDNATNETAYYVERANGSGGTLTWTRVATLAVNAQTWSDATVAQFSTYSYRVIAGNAGGDSAPSNVVAVTTPATLPAAPTTLRSPAKAYNRVDLTWVDVATNETAYYVERATQVGGAWLYVRVATLPAGTAAYSDTTVAASRAYRYRVQAMNSAGVSAYSNVVSVTTPAAPPLPPAAPTNLTAVARATFTSRSIVLSWTDNSTNESGFKIYRSLDQVTWTLVYTTTSNVRSYTNNNLLRNVTYYYRVCAVNAAGASAFTNVASARTAP
jgi:FtsP/CotA-like multicopper oxidase with cupredoxin domain/fibronectin type 3 domain-containing protein